MDIFLWQAVTRLMFNVSENLRLNWSGLFRLRAFTKCRNSEGLNQVHVHVYAHTIYCTSYYIRYKNTMCTETEEDFQSYRAEKI